jgi:hypothetical protein
MTITSEHQPDMGIDERVDRMLDEALEMTFPASDPITVPVPDADPTTQSRAAIA